MSEPYIGSLFSGGIDGMMAGFKLIDYGTPSLSIDLDKQAVELMESNYGHEIIHGDIREQSYHKFDHCNVLTITAPCQYYSNPRNINASKMDDDAQGRDLYLHGFRMIAMCQPEVYIAENVPQFLDYQVPSECFTDLKPYDTYVIQADTEEFNLPQTRNRVFFLGFRSGFSVQGHPDIFDNQTFKRQLTIEDIREPNPDVSIPQYVKNRVDGNYRDEPSVKGDQDLGNTCVAHYAKDRSTTMIEDDGNGYKGIRPMTPREYARLQGIPDTFSFEPTSMTTKYRMIGNSVSPVICRAIATEVQKHMEHLGGRQ
jgi:DNA (cytosine-5)-methyltransferase 1